MTVVFLSHAGFPAYIPGRFGVTVFFFLSGYLITTLLRREFEASGTIAFRSFYLRRVLRIFPPMWATIALVGGLAFAGIVEATFEQGAVVAMLANVTNQYVIAGGDVPDELDMLWSLAVEEHFYLLFPLAYLALQRRGMSPRRQAALLLAIAMMMLAWRVVLQTHGASYDWLAAGSDTRMDSLLWGSLLAIVANPVMDRQLVTRAVPSLAIFGAASLVLFASFRMVYEPGGWQFAVSFTVQGVALLPLFYVAIVRHEWLLFRWLNWSPIRYLGILSYTMYLVHLGLFTVFDRLAPNADPVTRAVVVYALTVGVAHASYVLMERPLGDLRRRLRPSGLAEADREAAAVLAAGKGSRGGSTPAPG